MTDDIQKAEDGVTYSRRELLKKYGAYAAPTVVAIALPSDAHAHMFGTYSSLLSCVTDTDNHGMGMAFNHCLNQHF